MNFQELLNYLETAGLNIGLKILGALVALVVGRWIIRFVVRLARRALELQVPEPTLNSYIGALISVLLHIALIVSILGFFGFETTTIFRAFSERQVFAQSPQVFSKSRPISISYRCAFPLKFTLTFCIF